MKKFRLFSVGIFGALISTAAFSSSSKLDINDGFYVSKESRCTEYSKSRDRFVACRPAPKDCLKVRKINDDEIAVEVFSTQADQHSCSLNGRAHRVNGVFTYSFGESKKSQTLEFIQAKDEVILKQNVPVGDDAENCGAHATFDGLVFKKTVREASSQSCFND